jgi:hypothetical protein
MSVHFYKDRLYPLQDRVLQCIGKLDTPFYLTGGTVVGRFLLNHRYSDDLDFFVNMHPDFKNETNRIIDLLKSNFKDVQLKIFQDTFAGVFIIEGDLKLKIELVNDVKFRVGKPTRLAEGYSIDIWRNIFSNKLTALSSRSAAKDFADVLFLSFEFQYNWREIIEYSKSKDAWVNEINISQYLMNFDVNSLSDVNFLEEIDFKKITRDHCAILARESLHGFDNSLYGKKL